VLFYRLLCGHGQGGHSSSIVIIETAICIRGLSPVAGFPKVPLDTIL
jgi:hypothetical protein